MRVIPVIDLRQGQAVRAIAGQREYYQPLSSALCPSAEPRRVVDAYRTVYPFTTFYLADLDAIAGAGDHRAVVEQLLAAFPELNWWLDAGFTHAEELRRWPLGARLRPVLGSESQASLDRFKALLSHAPQALLSLDFKQGQFLGPAELLTEAGSWPEEVILMQLDRVGINQGPDSHLPDIGDKRFYAAGGVRNRADLEQLAAAGYAGVLVASALHERRLSGSDMVALGDY
jgi:phosphoribosylformimino-5-aminoimidazole carboxamide ribotide isomerase